MLALAVVTMAHGLYEPALSRLGDRFLSRQERLLGSQSRWKRWFGLGLVFCTWAMIVGLYGLYIWWEAEYKGP